MNYLAHLHIAATTKTSLVGNFLGDFVKGSDFSSFDAEVVKGIRLHRKVDSFTDSHEIVKGLKTLFPKALRRMSGVCIDIWFDHLLLQHNHQFTPSLKYSIVDDFYQQLANIEVRTSRFAKVKASLINHRWLMDYQHQSTCRQAFYAIESRLKHRITFADASYEFLTEHQQHLEAQFLAFYPELLDFSRQSVAASSPD